MRRRLLLLAGVAFVVWVAVAAFWMARLASDLQAGRDAASDARDHLGPEQVAAREPVADLRSAASRFAAASDRVGGLVLAPVKLLPVLGRQLRSIEAMSSAAADVASAGVKAVERAGVVFDDPAAEGSGRVAQVRALSKLIDDVAAVLDGIDDLGPVEGLIGPLADARNELARELFDARRSLSRARAGARTALSLVTGPRRYLVIAANNAEMRAGSGMWLQGGVLTTADGALELGDMVSLHLDADPPDGAVMPTGSLAELWGFSEPGNEWRNLMSSPDFVQSAQLARQMWAAAGRGEVDGVIAIDAVGLQAIVAAIGPVTVEGREVGADDVLQQVLHDQYLQYGDISSQTGVNNIARRDALAALARSAVESVDAGSYPAATLVRTLGDAVAGRHLLAWSADVVEQQGWEAAGMTGPLEEDSLVLSLLNRGGNKLDWYLDVEASLEVAAGDGGWDAELTVQLRNETPVAGEPVYVAGPYPGLDIEPGTYRAILAVNLPAAAADATFDGVASLAVSGPDGPTRVVGFELDVPRQETRVVVLRFRLPREVRSVTVEPSARVPTVTWRHGGDEWEDSSSRTANW